MVAPEQGLTIAYSRVSGAAQQPDLVKQIKALEVYCDQHTLKVDEWMQDIGSGLNYQQKQFNRLMEMVELGQVRQRSMNRGGSTISEGSREASGTIVNLIK